MRLISNFSNGRLDILGKLSNYFKSGFVDLLWQRGWDSNPRYGLTRITS